VFLLNSYAIVQTGGKQYRVHEGDTIRVESLPGDEGDKIELDDVRMVSQDGDVTLGTPKVAGAKVVAELVSHGKGKKVVVFKFKAKTRYRRRMGHRQLYTELKVTDISLRKRRAAKKAVSEDETE
jgi:large subunit ribosomal protein L21